MKTLALGRRFDGAWRPDAWRPTLRISGRHLVMGLIAAASLWIRSSLPVTAIGTSIADDALFVQLAHNVASGHWLGPFYNMTLVKGPAYSIFIALSFWIGLPLKVAETSVYLVTAYLTSACVRRLSGSSALAVVMFEALAFNPVMWTGSLSRVIREGLYVSLSLAVITATLWLGSAAHDERRWPTVMKSLLCGSVWAAFWLTREEGGWIVPSVAVVILGSLAFPAARGRAPAPRVVAMAVRYGTALTAMLLLVSTVALINKVRYGYYETVEVKSAPFRRAYGALSRVTPQQWRRYVVFPKDVRERVYAVSTAARELAPTFEGPVGERWRKIGCNQTIAASCPEILSGWFQWALRDAVANAGHYSSASSAAAYYERLADQIDTACARGALLCTPERATLAPPFRSGYLMDAVRVAPALGAVILNSGVGEIGAPPSIGTPEQLTSMSDMVGTVQSTEPESRRPGLSPKRDRLLWRLATCIARLYRIMLIAGVPFALLGLCVAAVQLYRTREVDPLPLLALACAIGVVARIGLLAYLEVTSIPSLNTLYASPASPLLITAVVIGLYSCRARPGRGREAGAAGLARQDDHSVRPD